MQDNSGAKPQSNEKPGAGKLGKIFNALKCKTIRLDWAAQRGDAQAVEKLLAVGANIDGSQYRLTAAALTRAAKRGNLPMVDLLLDRNADKEVLNGHFDTPLVVAATHGQVETVKRLLERGANPNHAGENRYTALIAASMRGSAEIVKILLAHGADPSLEGARRFHSFYYTPLEWAEMKGRNAVIDVLEAHEREQRRAKETKAEIPVPAPAKRPGGFNL